MKANELRIENWYDHNGEYRQVTPNTIEEVWEAQRTWCKPIPLTEEWLLKFGFEYASDPDYYNITFEILDFYFQSNTELEGFVSIQINEKLVIKYVHQLQNLYFALTGEELTFKQQEQ